MTEAEEILLIAGGQSTIPLVSTLPADASLYAGQVYLAPRWPIVGSLPGTVVADQRLRIPEAGQKFGRECLGRSVVELDGKDTITANYQGSFNGSRKIEFQFLVIDEDTNYQAIFFIGTSLFLRIIPDGRPYLNCYNSSGVNNLDLVSTKRISKGMFNEVSIEILQDSLILTVNGVSVSAQWSDNNRGSAIDSDGLMTFSDSTAFVSPLQICCIKQYLNGTLLDWFKCDESTGTTLANTATPSRPASLSDSTAHALAWVPQDSVTMGVWQSDGTDWNAL